MEIAVEAAKEVVETVKEAGKIILSAHNQESVILIFKSFNKNLL